MSPLLTFAKRLVTTKGPFKDWWKPVVFFGLFFLILILPHTAR